tara:strand:- start:127 stop:606 length:480 start_codon:yes stop_codon:yes gene_type:complete
MEKRFKPLKKITVEESEKYISADEDFKNNFISYFTLIFVDDGWEKVTYFTKRPKKPIPTIGEGKEIIYVMSNPTFPGLLKVGYTGKEIEIRRKDLSRASGVPTPFKVEFIYKLHARGEELEREIHSYLKEYRTSNQREFFEMGLKQAIEAVKNVGKNYI